MDRKPRIAIVSFGSLDPAGTGGGLVAWHLGERLSRLGCLDKVVVSYRGKHQADFASDGPTVLLRYAYSAARSLRVPSHIARGLSERTFDLFSQRLIDKNTDLLVVCHPVLPRTLKKAKSLGIPTALLAMNPFDLCIEEVMLEEQRKRGIERTDGYTSQFRLREMARSYPYLDHIVSATSVIRDTYAEAGYGGRVVDLGIPLGPSRGVLNGVAHKKEDTFRVSYLAHTVLLKGLQYLLEAWELLDLGNSQLVVGSSVDPIVSRLIRSRLAQLERVTFAGHIEDINRFFGASSVLVCPSLIDGGPRVVYEAMACGLPVIVTEGCGAKDVVQNGVEGFVVPTRDPAAIKEKLEWFYKHPDEARQMGARGRAKIGRYSVEVFAEKTAELLVGIANRAASADLGRSSRNSANGK